MLSDQSRIIGQAKFTYSPLEKALEKQRQQKQLKNKREKQVRALEVLKPNAQKLTNKDVIPKNTLNEEAKNELNKTKVIEKMVYRENLVYRCKFKNFRTINR